VQRVAAVAGRTFMILAIMFCTPCLPLAASGSPKGNLPAQYTHR
jgi:hypothetical protein